MSAVQPISEKKIEANRSNAQHSTGPKTDAGKQASRLNALKHGLLAKEVVIDRGDYQENEQEFAQLLDELREQFMSVGVAEDLEVQKIALCYWRKMRAVRYEHGAIRNWTGDMRELEELSREESFESDLRCGSSLEHSSRGIQYLIDTLEEVKQEVHDEKVPEESLKRLVEYFPDAFALPDLAGVAEEMVDGVPLARVPLEYQRQVLDGIDEQLRRLSPLRAKVTAIEELNLESRIRAAALPKPWVVDKLIRYETSNDRELDRALNRLERMQARRRKEGGTPPEK